jgi:hypothetical protein
MPKSGEPAKIWNKWVQLLKYRPKTVKNDFKLDENNWVVGCFKWLSADLAGLSALYVSTTRKNLCRCLYLNIEKYNKPKFVVFKKWRIFYSNDYILIKDLTKKIVVNESRTPRGWAKMAVSANEFLFVSASKVPFLSDLLIKQFKAWL